MKNRSNKIYLFFKNNLFSAGISLVVLIFAVSLLAYDVITLKLYTLDDLNKSIINTEQREYELVLIYIGCSTCGAANKKELPIAYIEIKENLKQKALSEGLGFKTIGISKDFINTEGLVHLSKFDSFDDIMTGNGWSNMGILRYVYTDIPGKAATPQVLVTRRKFGTIVNDDITSYRGIEEEILITRKVGLQNINKMG